MESIGRITPATSRVLEVLLAADSSVWGLQVVKETGKKAGTVYPILDKLEAAGWVSSEWETNSDRKGPRRRYYRVENDAKAAASKYVRTQQVRERGQAKGASPAPGHAYQWVSA